MRFFSELLDERIVPQFHAIIIPPPSCPLPRPWMTAFGHLPTSLPVPIPDGHSRPLRASPFRRPLLPGELLPDFVRPVFWHPQAGDTVLVGSRLHLAHFLSYWQHW